MRRARRPRARETREPRDSFLVRATARCVFVAAVALAIIIGSHTLSLDSFDLVVSSRTPVDAMGHDRDAVRLSGDAQTSPATRPPPEGSSVDAGFPFPGSGHGAGVESHLTAQTATADTDDRSGEPAPPETPATDDVAVRDAAAEPSMSRQERVEAIADSLPFQWRPHGVTIRVGCHAELCAWGVHDSATNSIHIGDGAFATHARLHYVVSHEIAHAWQVTAGGEKKRSDDLASWGLSGKQGWEAAADCLAELWRATQHHHWNCPSDARAHMAQIYAQTPQRSQDFAVTP